METAKSQEAKRAYDLEERTAKFGESVIRFCKSLPKNDITGPLIPGREIGNQCWRQLLRSRRCHLRKRVSPENRHVQERSPRDETLASHDRRRRTRICSACSRNLEGSPG